MKSLRFLDRRTGYSLSAIGLMLGMVVPNLIPAFASAGNLTQRSIQMSSAVTGDKADGQGVSYKLTFTPTTSTVSANNGGIVVDFCSDTPLITTTCTAPTGFTAASASASTGTLTAAANSLSLKADTTGGTPFSVTFSNITNPTTVGTFYARVMSYKGTGNPVTNHVSTVNQGTPDDTGSIALSTTNTIGVTAYVLESMSFCVANVAPTSNCTGLTPGTTDPNVTLGQTTGSVTALDAQHVSTATLYAQLSTNASNGATVNLKSNATGCAGLFRNKVSNSTNCGIGPQKVAANTINIGDSLFGIKLGTAAAASDISSDPTKYTGTLVKANGSNYSTSNFYLDGDNTDATGVTSTYGSPFVDTGGTVVSNMDIPFTLGASISNQTPAGAYGANLSMIATGTF